MAELRHIVVLEGPFCNFSDFFLFAVWRLQISLRYEFLDLMAFSKIESRGFAVAAVFLRQPGWGAFGHRTPGRILDKVLPCAVTAQSAQRDFQGKVPLYATVFCFSF